MVNHLTFIQTTGSDTPNNSGDLLYTVVDQVDLEECKTIYKTNVDNSMMCASAAGKDACQVLQVSMLSLELTLTP